MLLYEIIETDAGMTVVELEEGLTPEDEAVRRGGVVVDPGPYVSYGEAYDALMAIGEEDEEEKDSLPPVL